MTIKALKLVTSEEIVAEIIEETPTYFKIKNVLTAAVQYTPDGKASIGFVPFMPYVEKGTEFTIPFERVILSTSVDSMMENQYNNVFGKIVTPTKKLIVG